MVPLRPVEPEAGGVCSGRFVAPPGRRGCFTNQGRWCQATPAWRATGNGRVRRAPEGLRGIRAIDLSRRGPVHLAVDHKQFPVRHLCETASVKREELFGPDDAAPQPANAESTAPGWSTDFRIRRKRHRRWRVRLLVRCDNADDHRLLARIPCRSTSAGLVSPTLEIGREQNSPGGPTCGTPHA